MKRNNKDRKVVIMLEDKNNNIDENIYLSSIPGFVENINDIRKNENWDKVNEFNLDEEW